MGPDNDIALIFERQGAARRLLAEPIITARTHPDDFALVSAHSDWLIQRFARVLGYRLTVGADHARLAKSGLVAPVTGTRDHDDATAFSPRAYAFLALTLAVLVEAPQRITRAELAAGVRAAAAEAGLPLDPEGRTGERRAFAAALRRLTEWGAVRPAAAAPAGPDPGPVPAPAAEPAAGRHTSAPPARAHEPAADDRLEVDHAVARGVVADPPHSAPDARGFVGAAQDTDPADPAAAELALRRLLAETAVVYRDDLPPAQRTHLARHQWRAVAELGGLLGCEAEIRAEGVALIMPDDTGAGTRLPVFPGTDPVSQAARLLLGRLAALLPSGGEPPGGAVPVPPEDLERALAAVTDPGGPAARHWARTAVPHDPDPENLGARVLTLLADHRLLDRAADVGASRFHGWTLPAAAARYRPPSPGAPEEAAGGGTP